METKVERLDKLRRWLALLYLVLVLTTLAVLLVWVPLAVPAYVSFLLLGFTVAIGVIAFVILPLYDWVNLKAKDEVPVRSRVSEVVTSCFLVIAPIFLLRNVLMLSAPVAFLLEITYTIIFLAYVFSRLFSRDFWRTRF